MCRRSGVQILGVSDHSLGGFWPRGKKMLRNSLLGVRVKGGEQTSQQLAGMCQTCILRPLYFHDLLRADICVSTKCPDYKIFMILPM